MTVAFDLPAGYRIERRERDTPIGDETAFVVIQTGDPTDPGSDDDEITAARVAYSPRDDWWYVHPGSTTDRIGGSDEVRARAAALAMAADEQDRRHRLML